MTNNNKIVILTILKLIKYIMILSWKKIIEEIKNGNLTIEPFDIKQLNTNSYNYRLASHLKVYDWFDWEKPIFKDVEIPETGYTLKKGYMYLWVTIENIGSTKFMSSLIWNSDMWRLWLFMQLSANMWHIWTSHSWTLEIYPTKDVVVYPWMIAWKVSFWDKKWDAELYQWNYKNFSKPQESLLIK